MTRRKDETSGWDLVAVGLSFGGGVRRQDKRDIDHNAREHRLREWRAALLRLSPNVHPLSLTTTRARVLHILYQPGLEVVDCDTQPHAASSPTTWFCLYAL